MRRYTTITINREILRDLERVKEEVGVESLGETIKYLISFWRKVRAKEAAEEIVRAREKGGFDEIRKVISEVRDLRWVRYT